MGGALIVWAGVGVIGFYSAMTLFIVPHLSLGAELTTNYHERSRLFGLRHAAFTAGSIIALISMQVFINAESSGPEVVRTTAATVAGLAAIVTALLVLFAVVRLRERREFQGRVNENPYHAFRDVWRNPHARLLIIVTFIENVGSAAIGALTLYVAQYVVGRIDLAPLIILAYMVPSTISVPLWIPLSRRFGKVRLWIFSMALTGVSFGVMFTLPVSHGGRSNLDDLHRRDVCWPRCGLWWHRWPLRPGRCHRL
ncbi:MAG: MFS transporter [Gammaproteobacteria bacterium]|nr:MFS transporter [Gammaproteobacteria bacterium]